MIVKSYNIDYNYKVPKSEKYIVKYDTKSDFTNGFTLELSNGEEIEISERDGAIEVMTMLGHSMTLQPRSGNVIAIISEKKNK